jgi:hypothetical protein
MRRFLLALCLAASCSADKSPAPPCEEAACCPTADNCPRGLVCDPVSMTCVLVGITPDAGPDAP